MASMVDDKVENLVISRKRRCAGANHLPCIGLNLTRSAYFGSDGCKKVRNKFPPLNLVQIFTLYYITFHWLLRTFPFFATLFVMELLLQPG